MKKITALLLAMTLAFSFCAFACADSMTISYTPAQAYELTIPSSTDFTSTKTSFDDTVALSGITLEADKQIIVKMSSANNFALKCADGDSKIAYTVSIDGSEVDNDCAVLLAAAGNKTASQTLSFATTEAAIAGATIAGAHTDTLTFEAIVWDSSATYEIGATIS